ncbi:MAG: ROK family transcriptional regulator, partial [Actinomycetota bacterium]|nr:ROK family transcriptional regulator [Actinomycetota bacterium]
AMRIPAIRAANSRIVLAHLADGHPATRAQLAKATSLTPQALGPILKGLVDDGLVLARNSARSGSGRPPVEYVMDPRGSLSVTVIYRFARFAILVSDASGLIISHREIRHKAATGPSRLLGRTFTHLDRMLDEGGLEVERITEVTFAVEGRVDEDRLIIHETTSWRQHDVDLAEYIRGRLPERSTLKLTDSNRAMAAAALRAVEVNPADLVLVLCIMYDTYIYLSADGSLMSSRSGKSGMLAHWPVDGNNRRCTCGRRGCLRTVSSGQAVVDNYEELTGKRLAAGIDVVNRVSIGDADAIEAVARSTDELSRALAPLLEMFDPDRLIVTGAVGGPESRGSHQLVAAIRQNLNATQRALQIDVVQPEVAKVPMAALLLRHP